jgi:hypothetical protein
MWLIGKTMTWATRRPRHMPAAWDVPLERTTSTQPGPSSPQAPRYGTPDGPNRSRRLLPQRRADGRSVQMPHDDAPDRWPPAVNTRPPPLGLPGIVTSQ